MVYQDWNIELFLLRRTGQHWLARVTTQSRLDVHQHCSKKRLQDPNFIGILPDAFQKAINGNEKEMVL
jgi:hypothetical protein